MEETMARLMLAVLLTAFSIGWAAAQGVGITAPGTCESKAVSKDGKPLAGAARTSFMAKCKREACAPKAVGSDGKPLKGAAKKSFMDKCQREQA
jgi:hypothetical protein